MSAKHDLLEKLRIDRSEDSVKSGRPAAGVSKWIGFGGLAVAVAISYAVFFYGDHANGNITPSSGPIAAGTDDPGVVADPVSRQNDQAVQPPARRNQVLNASGYVTARRMATVSSEITGRITEVLIEEGMSVEKGQIIARLDDALAQVDLKLALAQVEAAVADVASAEADLKEGERVLIRARELAASSYASEAELTRKSAQFEALTARRDRARADLRIARLQVERRQETIEKYLVRAPFSGVIVDKAAQAGEIVSPVSAGGGFTRTGIGTLVDMASLEIEVDVNESYIGRVSSDQRVTATLDAYPDWQIPASVIAIIPTADRSKATVRVRIAINVSDSRILPDMGVKVVFHGKDQEGSEDE